MTAYLTESDRTAIIAAVRAKKPHPLAHVKEGDIQKTIQEKLCSMMSPECLAVFKRHPQALRQRTIYNINRASYCLTIGDGDGAHAYLDSIETAYRNYREAFDTLQDRLKKVRTRAALKRIYPELDALLPPPEKASPQVPALLSALEGIQKLKPLDL